MLKEQGGPRKKQAAVLGLSSLVHAFPYQIPSWMPRVLVLLAQKSSDSALSKTISQTFAEFKRTHQDTWNRDKEKFKKDELDVFAELLLPPSYYA